MLQNYRFLSYLTLILIYLSIKFSMESHWSLSLFHSRAHTQWTTCSCSGSLVASSPNYNLVYLLLLWTCNTSYCSFSWTGQIIHSKKLSAAFNNTITKQRMLLIVIAGITIISINFLLIWTQLGLLRYYHKHFIWKTFQSGVMFNQHKYCLFEMTVPQQVVLCTSLFNHFSTVINMTYKWKTW